mmetsp:Transcript_32505/g.72294  ORF Transcript_32505/g.72294 Transcript_32505/m.72294 type:complete len:247 (-) Transcript_32505:468-1208(-)
MTLDRRYPPQGKKAPTQVSKMMKLPRTAGKELKNTGTVSAAAPSRKITRVPYSTPITLLSVANNKPPREMLHIRLAKTSPVGSGLPWRTPNRVGTHMKTNEYIDPSKEEFTKPTSNTLRSLRITRKPFAPKLAVILSSPSASSPPSALPSVPWFSRHLQTSGKASTVKKMAAWKGPISPLASAQSCANIPAAIADKPLPNDAQLNVSASQSSGKPNARCSDTIHDSKAEKSKEVLTPPATRDNKST